MRGTSQSLPELHSMSTGILLLFTGKDTWQWWNGFCAPEVCTSIKHLWGTCILIHCPTRHFKLAWFCINKKIFMAEISFPLLSVFEDDLSQHTFWKQLAQVLINDLYFYARDTPRVLNGPFTPWTHHHCSIWKLWQKWPSACLLDEVYRDVLNHVHLTSVDILQTQSKKDDMKGLFCKSHHKQCFGQLKQWLVLVLFWHDLTL